MCEAEARKGNCSRQQLKHLSIRRSAGQYGDPSIFGGRVWLRRLCVRKDCISDKKGKGVRQVGLLGKCKDDELVKH